ncbi:MAG: hypothetical protein OSA06_07670 [Acidimicrobiales bacterium]|nr:hypothetical protein [Acidimicrobiales bacterium]
MDRQYWWAAGGCPLLVVQPEQPVADALMVWLKTVSGIHAPGLMV